MFDVGSLAERDAEELFLSRARAIDPAFADTPAVAELCRRLDDLPLAIELAAARTSDFTADELLARVCERLDLLQAGHGADPRQQTLRATMEWSHELLDENEQRLFARLSIFESGCSLETAEQVCDADLETLQGLLDKSFLPRRAEDRMPRFSMLGTIRDYGRERLAASGEEEAVRERHARWIAALAERIPLESAGAEFDAVRSEVAEERAEVRAALRWTRATGRTELSLRIGAGLGGLWPHLFLEEAESWLEQAEQAAAEVPPPLRARVLRTCGTIAFFVLADVDRAVGLLERALEVATEAGDERLAAAIRYRLGMAAWDRGEPEGAVASLEQALADAKARGERPGEINALHHLGEALRDLGEFDRAEALLLESIALARSVGDVRMADETTHSLGDLNLDRGTPGRGRRAVRAEPARRPSAFRGTVGRLLRRRDRLRPGRARRRRGGGDALGSGRGDGAPGRLPDARQRTRPVRAAARPSRWLGGVGGGPRARRLRRRPSAPCRPSMPELPAGTVTFLFTDVEGSTRLLHDLGDERYAQALAEHRRCVREAAGTSSSPAGTEAPTKRLRWRSWSRSFRTSDWPVRR